jgi:hypothetical protein
MLKPNMWDHPDYACPIVGTCLSTAELRKLGARVQLILPPGATDYELHGCFVTLAKRSDKPAKNRAEVSGPQVRPADEAL